jgi:hypothetical protein
MVNASGYVFDLVVASLTIGYYESVDNKWVSRKNPAHRLLSTPPPVLLVEWLLTV